MIMLHTPIMTAIKMIAVRRLLRQMLRQAIFASIDNPLPPGFLQAGKGK
jgi:hypothetical protein